ncbi:hypothetical protein [Lacticaseibacillus zhaodongensis]|uniref:hypothetical protein n=1 Tax=Lacticaseibacillus zhaodongensis TaxID=2668065 RepID=UPI0012D2EA25|nr:hypothetical protein [Lacticaseibacillus zhaodongensis]
MLNYNDKEILSIVTSPLDPAEARRRITIKAETDAKARADNPLWAANDFATVNELLAYTELLGDKLYQALNTVKGLADTDFMDRLWIQSVAPNASHTTLVFFLAAADSNQELFTLVDPLSTDGHLVSSNLPTLEQITAKDGKLEFTDKEIDALIVLVKQMYAAGYGFHDINETVLQPVDGLTFQTKFDTSKPITTSQKVTAPGSLVLRLNISGTVAAYHVLDENNHDWMDLGSDRMEGDEFVWESTSIPEELVDQTLTLAVSVRSVDNVPAMDELFVIASSNAILMRETAKPGEYSLSLPNHRDLTVRVDATANTVTLAYGNPETQIIELNKQYPFLGQWLKAVLPKKPAFN